MLVEKFLYLVAFILGCDDMDLCSDPFIGFQKWHCDEFPNLKRYFTCVGGVLQLVHCKGDVSEVM